MKMNLRNGDGVLLLTIAICMSLTWWLQVSASAQTNDSSVTQQHSSADVRNAYWTRSDGSIANVPMAQATSGQSSPALLSRDGKTRVLIMFTPWTDPTEGAFTLNVPQGWQVSGGTMRKSAIDPRHIIHATSLDGNIQVMIGDPDLLPCEVPNRLLAYAGIREGQITKGAMGQPILIARYETGEQFARNYVAVRICPQAQITHSAIIPDATRDLTAKAVEYGRAQGAPAQATVGEAMFQCGSRSGYVRAGTVLAGSPAALQVWGAVEISGFAVADGGDTALACYVLNNMVASMQMDPNWEIRQARLTRDVTGAVTRAQHQMADSIAQHARQQVAHNQIDVMSSWEKRNKQMDAVMARDAEVRRGVTTVEDPIQGTRTVSNEYNYNWTRPDGSIVGTMTNTPPDYSSGWRLMTNH